MNLILLYHLQPHFHAVGFGWVVDTKKISDEHGWVIKNKKTRDSVYSTVYYLLSHCGVAKGVHSVSWFGDLGYRAKYASEIKVEDDKEESNSCPFCKCSLVFLTFVGTDRPPPPDIEFEALLNHRDWEECDSPWAKYQNKNPRGDFEFHDREGIGSYDYDIDKHKRRQRNKRHCTTDTATIDIITTKNDTFPHFLKGRAREGKGLAENS